MEEKLFNCMQSFIEYYLIYRALKGKCSSSLEVDKNQFMVAVSDANLQMCFVLWCKIFGSERNNKLHWKNFVSEEAFYERLIADYEISEEDFAKFSGDMREFRNKYVSHTDPYDEPVPYLKTAIYAVLVIDELMGKSESEVPFGTLASYLEVSLDKYEGIINNIIES